MIYRIISHNIPDMEHDMHYAFHEGLPTGEYPQVHDFFEFILVTNGEFLLILDGKSIWIKSGDMVLIQPDSIHSKFAKEGVDSTHINLAIRAQTMQELHKYLFSTSFGSILKCNRIVHLNKNEKTDLQTKMMYLNLFKHDEYSSKITYLRQLLIQIVYSYFLIETSHSTKTIIPDWLNRALKYLQTMDNLYLGLDHLIESTGKTKEHFYRSFKKYIGITPSQYINNTRLNYIANMLIHSNHEIVDLCEDVGFSSLSHFYALFKKSYGISPLAYRKAHQLLPDIQYESVFN